MAYTNDTKPSGTYLTDLRPPQGDWFGVSSKTIYGTDIGNPTNTLSAMLNGTGTLSVTGAGASPWSTQIFYIDLFNNFSISKIRYRSNIIGDVTSFDVYVATTYGTWGSAVASNLDPSASSSYKETSITPVVGRYLKVVIKNATFGSLGIYAWGSNTPFNGFDIYATPVYSFDTEPS